MPKHNKKSKKAEDEDFDDMLAEFYAADLIHDIQQRSARSGRQNRAHCSCAEGTGMEQRVKLFDVSGGKGGAECLRERHHRRLSDRQLGPAATTGTRRSPGEDSPAASLCLVWKS
jgi:hypothetical protein